MKEKIDRLLKLKTSMKTLKRIKRQGTDWNTHVFQYPKDTKDWYPKYIKNSLYVCAYQLQRILKLNNKETDTQFKSSHTQKKKFTKTNTSLKKY